ncbi:MAG TPA: serine/threonine-protein kinase, partial [Gemmatimonadaceae bacterium]|nr:serine/threonine-protein kinase [Gemmatimonadaceae bacterium]
MQVLYRDAAVEALSQKVEHARARKESLREAGLATDELDREILQLRRQLREGGQLLAGDALGDGRYLLMKRAGRGGFATVWEAWDKRSSQSVAIKVLHSHHAGDSHRRERFFRGARAMMKLAGPNVVRVLASEEEDGGFYYFVMEHVRGGNLNEAVLEGRLKKEGILPLILRVCETLAEAHAKGMVHRDIKPSNILLDEEGAPKLTDFDLIAAPDTTGG